MKVNSNCSGLLLFVFCPVVENKQVNQLVNFLVLLANEQTIWQISIDDLKVFVAILTKRNMNYDMMNEQ